ncbi:hypothetical protein FRC12_002576 [Ceratobasidium sp. 428]|nr:hypothetical protein FRC12_002576 [Ceratobasidium sp. 428]
MSTADFSDPPPPYESAHNSAPSDTYESGSESELGSDSEVGASFDSDAFREMLSRLSSPSLSSEVEDSELADSEVAGFEFEDFEIEDFADAMSTTESSTPSEGTTEANISSADSSYADDEWTPSDDYESASEAQEGPILKNLEIERVQLHYGHYRKNWMVETNAHETEFKSSRHSSESHNISYSEHRHRTYSIEMRDAVEHDPKGKRKQLESSDIGSPMSLDLVMDTPITEPQTPGLFYDLSAPGPSFVRWGDNVLYYPPTPSPSRVAAPELVLRYAPPSSRHHPYQRPRRDRAD